MARTTKKTQPTQAAAAQKQESAVVAEPAKAATAAKKHTPVKLDDSVLISVKSNVYGGLVYINRRTGDQTTWDRCGDVQTLTMGDLRAMKGTQRAFFENQWIYIVGVEDAEYEDVAPEDIYRSLMVTQYYKNILNPDNYAEIFTWSETRIRETIAGMSDGAKTNLIVAANTCIADGTLDSLRTIQLLEKCLGCELDKP